MAGLGPSFGAVSGIVWETAEYFTFVRNSPELATAYTDTLGDLSLVLGEPDGVGDRLDSAIPVYGSGWHLTQT